MKKLLLACFILTLAGGVFWSERRELARIGTERVQLRAELDRTLRQAADMEAESARLEASALERERVLQLKQEQLLAEAHQRAAATTNAFGPPGGVVAWAESDGFLWIEKRHLAGLGLEAFRDADTDRAFTEETSEAKALLSHLGQQFVEAHPEFAQLSSLTPEKAAEAQAEYVKLLTDALSTVTGKERRAVEAAIREAETAPRPGRASQPPAEYRVNEDTATILGLSVEERGAVAVAVRDMIGRYQELERLHVAVSEEPVEEQASVQLPTASFRVAAFPDAGGALKAEWVSALENILGPDRAAYFLEMSQSRIHSELGDFGTSERRITIVEGKGRYSVNETTTSGWSSGRGQGSPVGVPPAWRHLIVRPSNGGLPQLR